jgi:hypothetical protein
MMRNILFGLMILLVSLVIVNFVGAEMLVSDVGVQYDSSIVDKFNNGSLAVLVGVDIKDNSGIIVEGTKEQRDDLIEQKEDWKRNKTQEVFETLSGEEIVLRLGKIDIGGFEGNITKTGFEKLVNNSDVREIYDMTGAYPTHVAENQIGQENVVGDEMEEQNQIEGIQEEGFSFFWVILSIILLILIVLLFKFTKDKNE